MPTESPYVSPASFDATTSGATQNDPIPNPLGTWFLRGLCLAIGMTCALALSVNAADPDLWGHVQYGNDALRDGLEATTTYAFTTPPGYRWINHENLSELALAVGANAIGGQGLLAAKMLLGLFLLGILAWLAHRRGVGMFTLCGLSLLVAVNLTYHWAARPQLASYTGYTLMLVLLTWSFRGWEGRWRLPGLARRRDASGRPRLTLHVPTRDRFDARRLTRLWWAVPLFFLWANSHGAFVAGLAVFLTYCGCRAIEFLLVRGGKDASGAMLRLAVAGAAALCATLLNPYSYRLHAWLIESLGQPRPEITEWHPIAVGDVHFWPFVLLVSVTGLTLLFSRRPRDFTHLVILAATLWQAIEHQRHIPFFAIAVGVFLPRHLESVFLQARRRLNRAAQETVRPRAANARPAWWLKPAFGCGLFLVLSVLSYRLYDRVSAMRVERKDFPVSALQYMADHGLTEGRTHVMFNWAQYMIMAFGTPHAEQPGMKVGCDGRFRTCYPQELIDAHFDFVLGAGPEIERHRSPNSPPPQPDRVLKIGEPDFVLISRGQPHSLRVIREAGEAWTLLYRDSLAELWARTDKYGDPESPHYIAPEDRQLSGGEQAGYVHWPALPRRVEDLPPPPEHRRVSLRSATPVRRVSGDDR